MEELYDKVLGTQSLDHNGLPVVGEGSSLDLIRKQKQNNYTTDFGSWTQKAVVNPNERNAVKYREDGWSDHNQDRFEAQTGWNRFNNAAGKLVLGTAAKVGEGAGFLMGAPYELAKGVGATLLEAMGVETGIEGNFVSRTAGHGMVEMFSERDKEIQKGLPTYVPSN